jgi:hypothetical protein
VIGALKLIVACGFFIKLKSCNKGEWTSEYKREKSTVENEYRVLSQNYKYICLLGDFNSRTAENPDFIEIFINEHARYII